MRHTFRRAALFCGLWMSATGTASADVFCRGVIHQMYIQADGGLQIFPSFRNDWLQLCNLNATRAGVTVDTCKAWLALITTLQVTQQPVTIAYPGGSACDALATSQYAPAPAYVMLGKD